MATSPIRSEFEKEHARLKAAVTRAESNVVYSLGARPAYEALESAFEALADNEKATARGNLFAGLAARRYDLIVSEPSNPWVSGVSSLFTGEFYRLAQRYLSRRRAARVPA